MLVLLLLQMSTRVGPVFAFTGWSCFYCKCLHVLVWFLLQMFTHVGNVPTVNIHMCWPCSNCKCLQVLVLFMCWSCSYCKWVHVLALFQLQMSTHVGPVPTANVYTCCSCSCGKCLHILFLFLRQMSTRFSLVPTANVLIFYSKQLNFKDTAKYCITVTPSA